MAGNNVLIIYKEDYPWDVRVEKLIKSFKGLGYRVTVLSNSVNVGDRYSADGYCEIYRIPSLTALPNKISRLLKLPIWFNPLWMLTLWSLLRKNRFKTIVVRDLPLLKTAIVFKRKYNFNIIYDMAEVYPEMYMSMSEYAKLSILDKIIKSPVRARSYEASVLPKVDCVFTMIEESRDRLVNLGYPSDQSFIVSNTPYKEKVSTVPVRHEGSDLRIVYVGCITRLRGLDILIRAIANLVQEEGNDAAIYLDIVGAGPARNELVELNDQLGLSQYVTIHGWLEQFEVDNIVKKANLGVVTYRVCGHWNHTIPNKIFDYMAAGLPILATPVTPIKRIIEREKCGLVSVDESPEAICNSILMMRDSKFRSELGENGRQSVLNHFNWENEIVTMQRALRSLNGLNDLQCRD